MIQKRHLYFVLYIVGAAFAIALIGALIGLEVRAPDAWFVLIPVFLAIWAGLSYSIGWLRGYARGLWLYRLEAIAPQVVARVVARIVKPDQPLPSKYMSMASFALSMMVTIKILSVVSPQFVSAPGWWTLLIFGALNCYAIGLGDKILSMARAPQKG